MTKSEKAAIEKKNILTDTSNAPKQYMTLVVETQQFKTGY